jgi:hypothetical protein
MPWVCEQDHAMREITALALKLFYGVLPSIIAPQVRTVALTQLSREAAKVPKTVGESRIDRDIIQPSIIAGSRCDKGNVVLQHDDRVPHLLIETPKGEYDTTDQKG